MENHEQESQAPLASETVVFFGGEVKALDEEGKVGGYLVRFSTAKDPDLAGDFFTPETDFGPVKVSPVLYHHGQDSAIKGRRLGMGSLSTDDVGVWLEGQMDLRDEYEKAIFEMAKQGKLGWSSGTAAHLVEREAVGKSWHIKSWPLGLDASLTPTPCEPRTKAIPLKSYLAELKAESLTRLIDTVHTAFWNTYGRLDCDSWVSEVFDTDVIARVGDKYYRIPYTRDGDSVMFSTTGEWTEVQEKREWIEKKTVYLNHIAELKAQETDHAETDVQSVVVPVDAESEAAEPVGVKSDPDTTQTATMENVEKTPAQEPVVQEAAPEVKSEIVKPTEVLTITKAEYDQYKSLEVQAKAGAPEPQRVVKAAHDVSAANVNFKTGLGDTEAKAVAHWVRTGDMGGVSHMKAEGADGWGTVSGPQSIAIKASNDTDMNVGTAADGGNAVPTGHFQNIIARRDEAMLATRLGVRNIPGKGTTVNVPLDNEGDGEFISTAEGAANDRDAPAIGTKAMTLGKYTKRIELSDELMQDEDSRLLEFLENFVGRGMAKTHNSLLVTEVTTNGTNFKTFAGAAAIAAGEVQDIVYNNDLAFYLDDTGNVGWVTRPATYGLVAKLQGNDFIYDDTPQGSSRGQRSLLQYPVYFSNAVPAATTGLKSVLFGNFNYVGVRNEPEFRVLRDPYSASTTGQLRLHYYFRTVYGVLQAEAVGYGTQA